MWLNRSGNPNWQTALNIVKKLPNYFSSFWMFIIFIPTYFWFSGKAFHQCPLIMIAYISENRAHFGFWITLSADIADTAHYKCKVHFNTEYLKYLNHRQAYTIHPSIHVYTLCGVVKLNFIHILGWQIWEWTLWHLEILLLYHEAAMDVERCWWWGFHFQFSFWTLVLVISITIMSLVQLFMRKVTIE